MPFIISSAMVACMGLRERSEGAFAPRRTGPREGYGRAQLTPLEREEALSGKPLAGTGR